MNKIKIAFIGIGHDHAKPNITSFKNHTDLYEVAGYCIPEVDEPQNYFSPDDKLFEDMKKLTLEEILSDKSIEAVAIEAVDKKLTTFALMAAKAGKHIFMDKPGSGSLEEFSALIAEVKIDQAELLADVNSDGNYSHSKYHAQNRYSDFQITLIILHKKLLDFSVIFLIHKSLSFCPILRQIAVIIVDKYTISTLKKLY